MPELKAEQNRKVELAVYALIVLAALAATIWYARRDSNITAVASQGVVEPGVRLGDPSQWSAHERTLVMALQKGCHFCAASAPFYRRLAAALTGTTNPHVTAVLPQPVPEGTAYLATMRLNIGDVRQVDLPTLHIPGTPTLLLVDAQGVVKNVWVGKLSSAEEVQVLRALGLVR